VPLETCYEKVKELNYYRYGENCQEKEVLSWAEKIEDRLRSYGTHASGVVIGAEPISKKIPLYPGKDKKSTTQFEMYTVEERGLIKFDFLGLRALTTIDRCVKSISNKYGIDIDPLQIPVDDKEVYDQIQTGDVTGIFQLEGSSGMRDLVVRIRPQNLEELALLVAIYRPGPLESAMLKHYLKVRAGEASPHYIHEDLESILNSTDGMLIFQEQILEICKQLAGYSLAEADLMRRAVGKKKKKEMAAQHDKFTKGMIAHGIPKKKVQEIWEEIESFASYGFNKSHAACYAYIGYQMAWLKKHYLLEFMCACLISDSDEVDKVIQYISYCKSKKIKVLGPSINESQYNFSVTPDGKSIRFGLSAIKNLGKPVQEIIEERNTNGLFKSFLDFANRVNLSKINKRKLESLILAGSFDDLEEYTRASLLGGAEDVLRYKEDFKKYESKQKTYLKRLRMWAIRETNREDWEEMTKGERRTAGKLGYKKPAKLKEPIPVEECVLPSIPANNELDITELLSHEKELMGFFVTGHPLDNIKESMPHTIADIKEMSETKQIKTKTKITLIAIPNVIKEITTKKRKQKMSYIVLEDKTGTIQSVILPKPYSVYKGVIDIQTPARYDSVVEITEGDTGNIVKLMVTKVSMLPSVKAYRNKPIQITVPIDSLHEVSQKISEMRGDTFNVDLLAKSADDNTLRIGSIRCKGTRTNLQKSLKEYT